jgi:two-component system chemotaxis response regulator CheB
LTQEPLEQEGGRANVAPDVRPGQKLIQEDSEEQVDGDRNGEMAIYVCPECGGSMWQVNAGNVVRFTCHVGHAYSADDLLEGYNEDMERTLGHAARALRDRANLRRQLAKLASERNVGSLAALHDEDSRTDLQHAEAIEQMLASSRK